MTRLGVSEQMSSESILRQFMLSNSHKALCDPGEVRFGCGWGVEQLELLQFSVPAVPLGKGS